VAHELNNPMAAVQRAAGSLTDAVDEYARTVGESARDLPEAALQLAARVAADQERPRLDAIARSDAESSLEDTLTDLGVSEPWAAASALVEAGITADDLQGLGVDGQALEATVRLLSTTVGLRSLIHQIVEGSRRVSEIVRVLKGYSHLDEAPVQEVVVTDGIDDTLLLLSGAIGDIEVIREYGDVPEITAYPDELNQVWTNLIDNAVDAIADGGGGRIVVRAFSEGDSVVVEVADDGPGIPEDALPRVFDPFFTTKEPGQGTGLGLDISYAIVAQRHGGEITVKETGPGGTTFRVVLPVKGAAAER
jgi:signal transduction histidine kinase